MSAEILQQGLGYRFVDPALMRQALTHRSFGQPNNERLEFLGDSVLNCAVAALLYEHFGQLDEGDLSRLRANLVRQQSLYEVAQRIGLSEHLLLGEGERKSGGFRRPSILADAFEALIGAIYLDGGFDAARGALRTLYAQVLSKVDPKTLGKDAKTLLQESLQGKKLPLPVYTVVATHGAAHDQLFELECVIAKLGVRVRGKGGSRRAAEQEAAKLALDEMLAQEASPRRRTVRKRAVKSAPQGESVDPVDPGDAGAKGDGRGSNEAVGKTAPGGSVEGGGMRA